jgi:hypothetical protein
MYLLCPTKRRLGAYDSFYFLAVGYEISFVDLAGHRKSMISYPEVSCFSSKMKPVVQKRSDFVLFEFRLAL